MLSNPPQGTDTGLDPGNPPAVYSDAAEEYAAAETAAVLVDRSAMGRLHLKGADALDLLNRLSTNKLNDLEVDQGLYTVVTTNKGRIMDLLFLLRQEDRLLALTSPQARQPISDWIDFYTFIEEVSVEDHSGESAMIGLAGPRAGDLLDSVGGHEASTLAPNTSAMAEIDGILVLVVRTDFLGAPSYDLVTPAEGARKTWERLLDIGAAFEARPIGTEALELLRIERGIPAHGRELTEDFNPLEANLKAHISFNKECYIGQEVVARLDTYDKVQRRLVGLAWACGYDPSPGADLTAGDRVVGTVTSSAAPLRGPGRIGLGYVRNAHAEPGELLAMDADGDEVEVRVRELPAGP